MADEKAFNDIVFPTEAGRISVPEDLNSTLGQNPASIIKITPDYDLRIFELLRELSLGNEYINRAALNIVSIANTESEILFDSKSSETERKLMTEELEKAKKRWYPSSGGYSTFKRDVFYRAALYGCISLERIPALDLSGIEKVVLLFPGNIHFTYEAETDSYPAYQYAPNLLSSQRQTKAGAYVKLNPTTFTYASFSKIDESPYPMPPFMSALYNLVIKKDMKTNFASMMKRIGMLGFLQVMLNAPQRDSGMSTAAYESLLKRKLEENKSAANSAFASGVALGYKNQTEFELAGNKMNTAGAKDLIELIEGDIIKGVGQDPLLFGKNFSTTETIGRVILAMFQNLTEDFQTLVASVEAELFSQHLLLKGFRFPSVKVKYSRATIADKKRDAETEKLRIENVTAKLNLGFIDRTQAAQELGYDAPALSDKEYEKKTVPEPATSPKSDAPSEDESPDDTGGGSGEAEEAQNIKLELKRVLTKIPKGAEYPYSLPSVYSEDGQSFKIEFPEDSYLEKKANLYSKEILARFEKSLKAAKRRAAANFEKLPESASPETVANVLLLALYSAWEVEYLSGLKQTTQKHIEPIYDFYRREKEVFAKEKSSQTFYEPPEASFDLLDLRTIEYLSESDNFYLGKFITDEDTRRRFVEWVKMKHEAGETPAGKGESYISEFFEEFSELAMQEAYKITRVISTTMNAARSSANLLYINQAKLKRFQVVEVNDRITCRWCKHLHRKTFDVETAVTRLQKITKENPGNVGILSPFASSIKIEEFEELNETEIQNLSIDKPPFHPNCRGRIISVQ